MHNLQLLELLFYSLIDKFFFCPFNYLYFFFLVLLKFTLDARITDAIYSKDGANSSKASEKIIEKFEKQSKSMKL